LLLKKA